MEEILNSHPVSNLKFEISKTNIKGYSKMKKGELIKLMLKNKDRFKHIKKYEKVKQVKKEVKAEPKKSVSFTTKDGKKVSFNPKIKKIVKKTELKGMPQKKAPLLTERKGKKKAVKTTELKPKKKIKIKKDKLKKEIKEAKQQIKVIKDDIGFFRDVKFKLPLKVSVSFNVLTQTQPDELDDNDRDMLKGIKKLEELGRESFRLGKIPSIYYGKLEKLISRNQHIGLGGVIPKSQDKIDELTDEIVEVKKKQLEAYIKYKDANERYKQQLKAVEDLEEKYRKKTPKFTVRKGKKKAVKTTNLDDLIKKAEPKKKEKKENVYEGQDLKDSLEKENREPKIKEFGEYQRFKGSVIPKASIILKQPINYDKILDFLLKNENKDFFRDLLNSLRTSVELKQSKCEENISLLKTAIGFKNKEFTFKGKYPYGFNPGL